MAGQVKTTPGSIGYVELAYAKQNALPYAVVRNKSGRFVEPSLDSISAAAAGASMPADFRVSIVNAEGEKAYPISAFTWVLLYQDQPDKMKGTALLDYLWWAVHDGQKYGPSLNYAPLPDAVVGRIEKALESVTSGGQSLLHQG